MTDVLIISYIDSFCLNYLLCFCCFHFSGGSGSGHRSLNFNYIWLLFGSCLVQISKTISNISLFTLYYMPNLFEVFYMIIHIFLILICFKKRWWDFLYGEGAICQLKVINFLCFLLLFAIFMFWCMNVLWILITYQKIKCVVKV